MTLVNIAASVEKTKDSHVLLTVIAVNMNSSLIYKEQSKLDYDKYFLTTTDETVTEIVAKIKLSQLLPNAMFFEMLNGSVLGYRFHHQSGEMMPIGEKQKARSVSPIVDEFFKMEVYKPFTKQ